MSDSKIQTKKINWFIYALFLVFLTLKLCGVISWSWWWVTAPLWAGVALLAGVVLGAILVGLVAATFDKRRV